ncbi:NTP/NDP exchange transporter, partial [Fibrobacterota bacterium]
MDLFLNKVLGIRKQETSRAFLLFAYIFLVIASLLVVKPVANALFISHIGIGRLPLAFVLVALCSGLLMTVYARLSGRLELGRLMSGSLMICMLVFLIFRLLFAYDVSAAVLYYAFYIWVAIYGIIIASQFWLLTNVILNVREAKRLFGFIGAGAIAGGIFGGYLTNSLAEYFHSRNLLFLSVSFLILCHVLLQAVLRLPRPEPRRSGTVSTREQASPGNPLGELMKSRHLSLVAGIVGIGVLVATLADFQFRFLASEAIKNEDELASFFGFWQSNLSIIALTLQLFLTGRLVNLFGVHASLFVLPVTLAVGVAAVIFSPALWSAVLLKVSDGSFKQTFNKAGIELLLLPVPVQLKRQIKSFIDVSLDNLATGLSGVLLFVFTTALDCTVRGIGMLMAFFIAVWLVMVILVKSSYLQSFREAIENRTLDKGDPASEYKAGELLDFLDKMVESGNKRQVLYMLDHIDKKYHEHMMLVLKKMLKFPSKEVRIRAMKVAQELKSDFFKAEAVDMLAQSSQKLKIEAM